MTTAYPGAITSAQVQPEAYLDSVLTGQWTDIPLSVFDNAAGSPDILGLDPLGSVSVSNAASLDVVSLIDGTYDEYLLRLSGFKSNANNVTPYMRFSSDNGSTWISTTAYAYGGNAGTYSTTGATQVGFANIMGLDVNEYMHGIIRLFDPYNAGTYTGFISHLNNIRSSTQGGMETMGGSLWSAVAVNAVQFYQNTNNIYGTVYVFGRRL